MPRALLIAVSILSLAFPARAGVYNLAEMHPSIPLEETRNYILRLRSAAGPSKATPESFKGQVLRQSEDLEHLLSADTAGTLDRINLSACYLRSNRPGDAERVLSRAPQDHFLVQSNRAAAYFLAGELQMAIRHQERVLTLWPEVWAGWTAERLRHYRACELALLKLYRSREEEMRRGQRGPVDVDPLFSGLQFVGPGGEYEAGGLDQGIRDRLPTNAFAVVYQLCIWFPTDQRLYWQLGELLNVAGSIEPASEILVELVQGGALFRDLHRHRRILKDALPVFKAMRDPATRGQLLSAALLLGRPPLLSPGVGDAGWVAGATLANQVVPLLNKEMSAFPYVPGGVTGSSAQEPTLPFNFNHVTVGFASGFLVAALMGFQWQEWRRRRQQVSVRRQQLPSSWPQE